MIYVVSRYILELIFLKDRKGRVLGFDDVRHYHKIIKALVETDRIMGEIDEVMHKNKLEK